MTPNEIDFLMKIKWMRFCQTAYSKTKRSMYLREAKELEKIVDKKVKELFDELMITGYIKLSYHEVMKQQKEKNENDQLNFNM